MNPSHCLKVAAVAVSALLLTAAVSVPTSAGAADATADVEPVGSLSAAEQRRQEPDPPLILTPAERAPATTVPTDRYDMAGRCYTMSTRDGRFLTKAGSAYELVDDADAAVAVHFQAIELGRYLLWDVDRQFVDHDGAAADEPSEDAEWTVEGTSNDFTLTESLVGVTDGWRFRLTTGCPQWPEVEVNVEGDPFAGVTAIQEVRGYIDDHMHEITTSFLGGGIHCGSPWHKYGVVYALKDCQDHSTTQGYLALPEIVLSGNVTHDPVGWPTFKDWPSPESLTHESGYYKWLERSWRDGQRIFVNLLVENEVLCVLYPNIANPTANVPGVTKNCNDMDQVRFQAQQTHALQDYIDAQWGGPGKGWFRIVDTPQDARRIVNEGKLAVILGTETSDIFNCSKGLAATDLLDQLGIDTPLTCTDEDLDAGLDELYDLGVRQMVITHKFDNAFGGAKGDGGFNGIATNLGNFLITGSFFRMKPCPDGLGPDNAQLGANDIPNDQLAQLVGTIGGAVSTLPLPIALPLVYPYGEQCNDRHLTELGDHMIRKMVERDMLIDVDHFNAQSRSDVLDILEELHYPGVISSHSWSDDAAYERIYRLGGFISPYAGGSEGFVDKWRSMVEKMDGRFFWGIGYGADMNGLGPQGGPRGADADNPVTYPFEAFGGITVDRQRSGERVYDVNVDGVAHYGLYPDWRQDLKMLAGEAILTDMRRGSEAYLQTWERANGATNDACREPDLRRPASDFAAIATGTTAEDVLYTYGQPHVRVGDQYRYCALSGTDDATVTVTFDDGRVSAVRGADRANDPGTDDPRADDPDRSTGGGSADGGRDVGDAIGQGSTGESARAGTDGLPETGGPSARWPVGGVAALVIGALMVASCRRLRLDGSR